MYGDIRWHTTNQEFEIRIINGYNVDIHKTDYKAGLLHDSFNQSWGNIRNSLPTFVRRLHFRGDIQGIKAQYTFDDRVFFDVGTYFSGLPDYEFHIRPLA